MTEPPAAQHGAIVDPQWLEHPRWVYQVGRQRLERTDQWVGAVVASGSLVVGFASSVASGFHPAARWILLLSTVTALAAVLLTGLAIRPKKFRTFSTGFYRTLWAQDKAESFVGGIEVSFIEELVGGDDPESGVIRALERQTEQRMKGVNRGLLLLWVSLSLLVTAVLVDNIAIS